MPGLACRPMVTRSVTPLSTAIGTGASPMEPTSAAPERNASITAAPPLKSANSTPYGASLPASARFHGSDWVAFCSATTILVPAGTSVVAAIFTESMAVPESSWESPQALAHNETASRAASFQRVRRCDDISLVPSCSSSDLDFVDNTEFGEQTPSQRGEFARVTRTGLGHRRPRRPARSRRRSARSRGRPGRSPRRRRG